MNTYSLVFQIQRIHSLGCRSALCRAFAADTIFAYSFRDAEPEGKTTNNNLENHISNFSKDIFCELMMGF